MGCKAEPKAAPAAVDSAPAATPAAAPVTVSQSPAFDSALYRAGENGNRSAAERRLDHGAAINVPNPNNGRTALHAAANNGHKKLVSFLLLRGADANARDKDGNTPLHLAAVAGHNETVAALMASSNQTIRNNNGRTAREIAASRVLSYFPPQ